jgi:hypothetical protein
MPLLSIRLLNALFVLITLGVVSLPLQAEESTSRVVKSFSYINNLENDEISRKAEFDRADIQILDALIKEGFRPESTPAGVHADTIVVHYEGDISIYDATTTLISDFDNDGFYHRFSVEIDADTIYSESWVFAELYLSYEGGPWNYYAISDDYPIHGDSDLDVFVIETELAEGFPAGYYDIRIELYDAESGDWVQSYGPYDDGSLSTLPLEDSVYDEDFQSVAYTTEVIVAGHGHGGLSVWLLAVFGLSGVFRFYCRYRCYGTRLG